MSRIYRNESNIYNQALYIDLYELDVYELRQLEHFRVVSPEEDSYETFGEQIQHIISNVSGYAIKEVEYSATHPIRLTPYKITPPYFQPKNAKIIDPTFWVNKSTYICSHLRTAVQLESS